VTATYGYWPNTNLIANVTYVNNPHPRTPATPKKQIPFSQIVEAIDMKRLLFTLTILLAGCTIPCEQKPCYQEISKQDFINLVHHHASNDEAIVAVVYVGSDADYDYIYSYTPGFVYNSKYAYYKLKVGILNLNNHYDFNASSHQDVEIINNFPSDDVIKEQLDKLVGP
jgi:hypothetical protein